MPVDEDEDETDEDECEEVAVGDCIDVTTVVTVDPPGEDGDCVMVETAVDGVVEGVGVGVVEGVNNDELGVENDEELENKDELESDVVEEDEGVVSGRLMEGEEVEAGAEVGLLSALGLDEAEGELGDDGVGVGDASVLVELELDIVNCLPNTSFRGRPQQCTPTWNPHLWAVGRGRRVDVSNYGKEQWACFAVEGRDSATTDHVEWTHSERERQMIGRGSVN